MCTHHRLQPFVFRLICKDLRSCGHSNTINSCPTLSFKVTSMWPSSDLRLRFISSLDNLPHAWLYHCLILRVSSSTSQILSSTLLESNCTTFFLSVCVYVCVCFRDMVIQSLYHIKLEQLPHFYNEGINSSSFKEMYLISQHCSWHMKN